MPSNGSSQQPAAITLDLAPDGQLLVQVPESGAGHLFKLPFDLRGLACLATILREHQREARRIAEPGTPTQWNVDQLLAAMSRQVARKKPARDLPFIDLKELEL